MGRMDGRWIGRLLCSVDAGAAILAFAVWLAVWLCGARLCFWCFLRAELVALERLFILCEAISFVALNL